MQYCSVVPKEAVDKYGTDFRRHPVGTGPFQFVAWEEGQALVLKKNPAYFETDSAGNRLPYVNGVKVSFYDSKATEFLLFRQKELEFTNDIEASFKDEILTKKGTLRKDWEGKIVLQATPYLNIEYLGILVDSTNKLVANSPLRFKKIRQAINYGFDRKKMVLYLRNSLGTAAESVFIPMGLPSFDTTAVKGYHYDPARAKQLLAEAGFPGFVIKSWLGVFGPRGLPDAIRDQLSTVMSEIVKSPAPETQLRRVGFEPVGMNAAAFSRFYVGELERWRKIANETGIKEVH